MLIGQLSSSQSPASVKDSIKDSKVERDKGGHSTLTSGLDTYACIYAPKSYIYMGTQAHIYHTHTYINHLFYFALKD